MVSTNLFSNFLSRNLALIENYPSRNLPLGTLPLIPLFFKSGGGYLQ